MGKESTPILTICSTICLERKGGTTIGWHFRVTDGMVEVGEGAFDDADLRTRVDYQAVLPVARLVYGTSDEAMAEATRLREAARETGEQVGDETALPPELLQRLFAVHNELARSPRAFLVPRTRIWPQYKSEFDTSIATMWDLRAPAADVLAGIQGRVQRELDRVAEKRRLRGQAQPGASA